MVKQFPIVNTKIDHRLRNFARKRCRNRMSSCTENILVIKQIHDRKWRKFSWGHQGTSVALKKQKVLANCWKLSPHRCYCWVWQTQWDTILWPLNLLPSVLKWLRRVHLGILISTCRGKKIPQYYINIHVIHQYITYAETMRFVCFICPWQPSQ